MEYDPLLARPGDLSPFERQMLSEERPAKQITFPSPRSGKDIKAALWAPTDGEIAEAQAAATTYLKEVLKLDEYRLSLALESNLYKAEEERQILAVVLRDPTKHDRPLSSAEALRKFLDPDHRKVIFSKLSAFLDERYPIKEATDPAKIQALVADLKAAGALSEYLISCDSATLRNIVLSLAEAAQAPTTPSSSDTSS